MTLIAERDGSEGRWERLAPLSGIVAAILFWVGVIVIENVGNPPDRDDALPRDFLTYYRDDDGSIWAGSWIFLLGVPFFLWFLGSVRAVLHRAEGGVGRLASVAYAGGVGTALMLAAAGATQISGAIAADESETLTPQTAETLFWAGDGFFVVATFFLAAFFAATAVVSLSTRVFPFWFGVVTAILAVAAAIPFISWAVVLFALPLWMLFLGIWLLVRRPVPAT
jgi:hypothetical protein